uniref:aralkylamine N-acetyltransferase n=1 Tax=Timema bartmani TaxID=61472 RepID=A0A7R9EY76_9NEOP|nr:unnamed protein product [Timema bartmani]
MYMKKPRLDRVSNESELGVWFERESKSQQPASGAEDALNPLAGLSLGAFSSSGKLVGVSLNGSNEPGHIPEMEAKVVNCTNSKFQKILNLLTCVEKEADVFTRFPDVHKILEVRILAVDEAWGGRGIGTKLLDMSRQIAIQNGFPLFRVDCTSHYSARAVAKLGLSCIYTLLYKDHKNQDGSPVFNPAHPHNEVKTYVERIQA